MEVLSAERAKALDSETVNEIGIQGIVLMESAGLEMTNNMKDRGKSFILFCGVGNNGGDGLVIARKISNGK